MSVRVVIVDDEPQCILRLQTDLSALDDFEVVATSSSATSAKALVVGMQPDVLFIDMEMPGLTGVDVLQSLQGEVSESLIVVFYSAFDKYMLDALRASAYDFLLKPYSEEELAVVVDRIRQRVNEPKSCNCDLSQELLSLDGAMSKQVAVQSVSGLLLVRAEEVFDCFFDETSHMWCLRMTNGMEYKLRKQTTAKMVLSISPSFVQVRQDCIINLDYLVSIENYTLRCVFMPPFDKEEIIVSRRCYKAVKERLEIL